MTLYFYDLETSGIDSRYQRIMQFGGQRTDEDLNPIGEPFQTLVKLTDEVLPEPDAVLITGITPQQSIAEGISEVSLIKYLNKEVFTPDTTVLGFNTIRFDDEFVRNLLYRNYHDPYLREWAEGRSRWDIIDVVRMTRALRPEGINWPVGKDGVPTNRLEELTKANGIEHSNAHDALADVSATIDVAKLIKTKQPKLFSHMLNMKDKRQVANLIGLGAQPFVHSSGMIKSEYCNTSVFLPLATHPDNSNAILCWDLRHSPKQWSDADVDEIARLAFSNWRELAKTDDLRLPVKAVHVNKSPAVAPFGVLDDASQERIGLTLSQVQTHAKELKSMVGFADKIAEAWQQNAFDKAEDVDGQIYDGFVSDQDKQLMQAVHRMSEPELSGEMPKFTDDRLKKLWVRYKARNFPRTLTDEERAIWEQYRAKRIKSGPGISLAKFMVRLKTLAEENVNDRHKQFLIEELQLYAESILPYENTSLDLGEDL
jgi:exodeoxyribonuclease-1